jgi:aryl-alcohol dehydrogenase-like predicted oxidoreductase
MGLVVWSPLASGVLTGKYDEGVPAGARLDRMGWLRERLLTEANLARVRRFGEIAAEVGVSRTRLALAWALHQRGVSSVILGATSTAQLDENLAALDVEITPQLQQQLGALFVP